MVADLPTAWISCKSRKLPPVEELELEKDLDPLVEEELPPDAAAAAAVAQKEQRRISLGFLD